MFTLHPKDSKNKNHLERGQALVEYALIAVLIGIAFGLALAASAPITGGIFNAVVNDLLQQTEVGAVPNAEGFWETVTAVYNFDPPEGSLPTNTPSAPTETPTEGPSPVPTATYTATHPIPSRTPRPTITPVDILKNAPFRDTVDEPGWWRLDKNVHFNGLPWTGQFWNNNSFTGAPVHTRSGIWELNYNGPFLSDFPTDNFSAKFERQIILSQEQTINFRIRVDDGVEMWSKTDEVTTKITLTHNENNNTDSWKGQSAVGYYTGSVRLPAGTHYILLNYVEYTGDSVLQVDMTAGGANPDDTSVDSGGNAATNAFFCSWGPVEDQRNANTNFKMFDDYTLGQNAAGTRCYLEFRGAAVMPANWSQMQLRFWDVWEFDQVGVDGWLEIAEYVQDPAYTWPSVLREDLNWTKIDLHRNGTANFNWTRTVVDLEPYITAFTSPTGTTKQVAFRFVMQIPAGTTAARQWFIDDIEFANKVEKTYPVDKLWALNDANERFDFITTGGTSNPGQQSGWGLVTNNRLGATGYAFHDSVNAATDPEQIAFLGGTNPTQYKNLTFQPASDFESDMRIHALEIDGWIDLNNAPRPDSFGNNGERVLSFYHAYDLGSRTGLMVQYSETPYGTSPAVWKTFTDGALRAVTTTGVASALTLQEYTLSLEDLPTSPSRIRIRFAMLVRANADLRDGWWIDQIRLGRAEDNKWLNYPFSDDVQGQGPLYNFRYTGSWGATTLRGHQRVTANPGDVEISYASSPHQNYTNNSTSYMTLRWPIDLYNDTPNKIVQIEAGGALGTTNSHGGPAVDPHLTFYVWREIANNDEFIVQWKRASETDASYRNLWLYRYNMNTRVSINRAWEPTRVSLKPILNSLTGAPGVGTGAQLVDDDIILRFVLKADNSNNAAGLFIDDIRLEESTLASHNFRLWPSTESRNLYGSPLNPDPVIGTGNGSYFFSDPDGSIDGRRYENDWKMGGMWSAQNFETHGGSGAIAFHDSVTGNQDKAPTGLYRIPAWASDFGDTAWYTPLRGLSMLEVDRVFDLRGVNAEDEAPTLNFWTRYHIGQSSFIRVQVSHRLPASGLDAAMQSRCGNATGLYQCYDQEYGWSEWRTNYPGTTNPIWSTGTVDGSLASYGWRKISVNLAPYAYQTASGAEGKEIRIRFVYDTIDTYNSYDGWYIDGVDLQYRLPLPTTAIISTTFVDSGLSTVNWITEGNWGLDPNIYIGGSGIPSSIGTWKGDWWECRSGRNPDCYALGGTLGFSGNARFGPGADLMLRNPSRPAPAKTEYYSTINLNYGNGSPVWNWSPSDNLVAEFTLEVLVDGSFIQPGSRSFTTRSDDGVRLKIEELDGSGNPIPNAIAWNIINNWTDHGTVTDQGVTPPGLSFLLNRRYRLTLQYYELSGGGTITLSVSNGRYSFSDSPRLGGSISPDTPPIPYANTSLLGRRLIDLTGFDNTNYPIMELQSKYRLHDSSRARVEVSSDGGFTWVTTGMNTNIGAVSTSGTSWSGASGVGNPHTDAWNVRFYNLSSFEGRKILIRFRLDRQTAYCYRNENCDNSAVVGWDAVGSGANPTLAIKDAYYDGWWIGYIRVMRFP